MTIGIIGAGISGLVAGRILAKAGHDVTVFEKSRGYGGRMATRYFGENREIKLDHGATSFTAKSDEFKAFIAELSDKGLVEPWTDSISFHDGKELLAVHPARENTTQYIAKDGMNTIGRYLSRWVDVKLESRVTGITMLGKNSQKKKHWMINLQNFNVFEMDAVLIATPGVQAYGLIQTSQDETAVRNIIRQIDEVHYKPSFSVMLGYKNGEKPDWKAFAANNDIISYVSNESSKRDTGEEVNLVVQTTAEFATKHAKDDKEAVASLVVQELRSLAGKWAGNPVWAQVHYWRYTRPGMVFDTPFMELEGHPAMLALVGDYFNGSDVEAAYLSGYRLGNHWVQKLQKGK